MTMHSLKTEAPRKLKAWLDSSNNAGRGSSDVKAVELQAAPMDSTDEFTVECLCRICGFRPDRPDPSDTGCVRGNSARYLKSRFRLWKCPSCETIRALDPFCFKEAYQDYVLKKRVLNPFERGILKNLLRRLRKGALTKSSSILDYGCGNGLFVEYLQSMGFEHVTGYDPYDDGYARPLLSEARFDYVILNDVIEHVEDPRALLRECCRYVAPGGYLYIGTSDSVSVKMDDLEPHLMLLHLPYHRIIFTEETLHLLGMELGWDSVRSWSRSYIETLRPAANYRFMYELNHMLGHNLDLALGSAAIRAVCLSPRLWFFALFGYFFPRAMEPALLLRRPS